MPELLYLSHQEVASVAPPWGEIIELVALALREKAHGRVLMPPKPTIHPYPGSLLQAMPAWVEAAQAGGVKWVAAFAGNKQHGLPAVSGLIVLNHPETGVPEAILDAGWITAARTGAATAVAARFLARLDAETLGLLGAGVQARANLAALRQVLPQLRRVRVYAPRSEAVQRFQNDVQAGYGVEVKRASSAEEAVQGADVVVTAAPWPRVTGRPPVMPEWLAPGVFACVIDLDASLTAGAAAVCDRFFVDDLPTMTSAREKGTFDGWPEAEDLTAVIAEVTPRRQNAGERSLAVILGLGMYDVVVARRVVEQARRRGVGTRLPL